MLGRVPSELFKIVSWNVNSLRARMPLVLRYLDERAPDVLCLQETRLDASKIDCAALRERGYHVLAGGTRAYAGVATLSRRPARQVVHGFGPAMEHSDRRVLCLIDELWIDNVYVPTRRAIGKSEFFEQLHQDYSARFSPRSDALVLCGDFNVCFDRRDLASLRMISEPEQFGHRPEDLAFRRALSFGLHDCFRKHQDQGGLFSWFPPASWALKRNYGMRLDYVFATPPAYDRCSAAEHDLEPRSWARPSDHIPVVASFERSL